MLLVIVEYFVFLDTYKDVFSIDHILDDIQGRQAVLEDKTFPAAF
jgi:hypothetical protein